MGSKWEVMTKVSNSRTGIRHQATGRQEVIGEGKESPGMRMESGEVEINTEDEGSVEVYKGDVGTDHCGTT